MNCNLRCRYCYSGEKRHEAMSVEVGRAAIDRFMASTHHLLVQFFGGEPLLRLGVLRELVSHAEARSRELRVPVSFVLVTNGTLFDKDVAKLCADHRIELSVSLDGDASSQDLNRIFPNGRGSFSVIEPHLPELVALRAHVVSVVKANNVANLARSMKYLLDLGFRNIHISPDHTDPGMALALAEYEKQLEQVGREYVELVRSGDPTFISVFDDGAHPFSRGPCKLGSGELSVDPYGRIYPCACFVDHDRYPLGHVETGLDPILHSIFLEDLGLLHRKIEAEHRDCPAHSFCRKGCGCTNIVSTGEMTGIVPVTCEIGRVHARTAERVREMERA